MNKIQKAFAKRTPTTVNSVLVTPSSGTIIDKASDLSGATAGKYVLADLNADECKAWLDSKSNGFSNQSEPPIEYTNSGYIYACGGIAAMSSTSTTTAAVKAAAVEAYGEGGAPGLAALLAYIGYKA